MQFLVAIAAVAAGMLGLQAKTVAWYHFDEGANGETMTGGQPIVLNAVDTTSLKGKPYSLGGTRVFNTAGNLPVYTNDMPSCVSWFDPVTGARGEDNRSVYLKTDNGKSSYAASSIVIEDDADNPMLRCQNITAEMMIKSSPSATPQYAYGDWLHALTMLTGTSGNNKSWAIMIRGSGQIICVINDSSNSFDGTSTSGAQGGGGAAGYSYSTVVSGSVPKITDGKWHHVAITYDGTTVRLYADYTLVGWLDWSGPLVYNGGQLCIGANPGTNYGAWDGFIDEVRISDEALPPEKFLHIGGLANNASDQDTAIYLPFNSFEFSTDKFFGAAGSLIFHNSACSTNANLINMSVSTITAGVYPRLDTGVASVVSNELHAGVFATNTIDNIGCWTYTNNPAYPEKARWIIIDDFSKNDNKHLISSGDFTAEFFLKVPTTPTSTSRVLVENSGVKGAGTIQLTVSSSYLYCTLYSKEEYDKYETTDGYSMVSTDFYTPVGNIVGGDWHHVALVVDRTNKRAMLYLDGKLIRGVEDFVLASDPSTYTYNDYRYLKIGEGWSGNSANALHGLSIDEFRITRRALAPQEFLMAGAALSSAASEELANGATREWIGFEGDLSVGPNDAAVPDGKSTATTVSVAYSGDVPGIPGGKLVDGNDNVIRAANMKSMYFSNAYGYNDTSAYTGSQRLLFERNVLLEKDMKSMTLEFFMKGTKDQAKAWASIVRGYCNVNGADTEGQRMWGVGYKDAAGHIYALMDSNGKAPATLHYPDDTVSFADGRWHHVAVTYEPDGNGNTLCKVYKDYKQIGSTKLFTGELECGDHGASSVAIGSAYNGYIDEVRISKGVLSVNQMLHVEKPGSIIIIR